MPRIVCISDTHLRTLEVPEGDILVHTGDHTLRGTFAEVTQAAKWLGSLPHKAKITIAGNHDWLFERAPAAARARFANEGVTYLHDSSDVVSGLRFYGSPYQPAFHDWAFNLPRNGEEIAAKWRAVPAGIDVLLTHGPPYGILDCTSWEGIHVGCERLAAALLRIKPRLHVFGHVHEGYGCIERDGVIYANASSCNLNYSPVNPPIVIDL